MNMPFHTHHHSSGSSSHHNSSSNLPGTATGIYQAAQTLGAIGAPAGNLRIATSENANTNTNTGGDNSFASGENIPGLSGEVQTAPPSGGGLPGPRSGPSNTVSAPVSAGTNLQFETPRRANTLARQSDELHMHSSALSPGQHGYHQQSPRTQQHPRQNQDYSGSGPPHINLLQATPQGSTYSNTSSGVNLPGVLQPGSSSRPLPSSSNTAPAGVPTIPHIQTQVQQYATPPKPSNINHSHSYSRSSPSGGLDSPKYVPYPGTPETSKYGSQTIQKYTPTQSQQGAISISPLGLADIRPRAGSGLSDGPTSANPYPYDDESLTPTNSNYQASWAIYAFDWCKWSVYRHNSGGGSGGGGGGAGKVAVGSYLEDGHNYVRGARHSESSLFSFTVVPLGIYLAGTMF